MEQVSLYDRATGRVFKTWPVVADDILKRSGDRYGKGEACPENERLSAKEVAKIEKAEAKPAEPALKVMAGEGLPMPATDAPVQTPPPANPAEPIADVPVVGNGPAAEHFALPLDEAGQSRVATPVDPTPHPLDHDANGKKGGSKAKKAKAAERSPEEQAERAEIIASLRLKGVTFFAGDTTENLRAKLTGNPDDLADVRTTPGDSQEKLEAIEREVDEANGKAAD